MNAELRASAGANSSYRLTESDPAWLAEISSELIPDYDELKRSMNLEAQAHGDGYMSLPAPDDGEMNDVQLRIRGFALQKIALLYAFLSTQLSSATSQMVGDAERLDLRNSQLEAETIFKRSLLDNAPLRRASQELAAAEHALRYFVARNRLTRPPRYTESTWLIAAAFLALMLVESFFNGFIFKDVSEGGWSTGFILALGISLVNVTLGVMGGAVGWRLIGHRFILPRIIGWVVTLFATAAAVVWNILIAHYRQLAEAWIQTMSASHSILDSPASAVAAVDVESIVSPQALFLDAWRHMQQIGWLRLDSLWSSLLLGIGILIFLLACSKTCNDLDRYWDYRKFDMRRKNAEDNFESECIEVMNRTLAKLDEWLQSCRQLFKRIEGQSFRSEAVADLAEQRAAEVANTIAQWAHESKRLLKFYRDENHKVRGPSVATPKYWSSYPTVEDYHDLLRVTDGGGRNVELAESYLRTIRRRRAAQPDIRASNQKAFAELERFIHGLRASVPTKVEQARKAARDHAQTPLAPRVDVAGLLKGAEQTVAYFLERAGCQLSMEGEEMTVRQAPEPLNVYAPFPVSISLLHAPDCDVINTLAKKAKAPHAEKESLACLVYEEAPDTMARTEFAVVRSRHKVSILPMDLNVVRRSLADGPHRCATLLDGAWKNYGPGIDLFSLQNAVTDSMLFFGRQPLLNELREHLSRRQVVGLFGLRKSGKTSVLNHLAATLQDHVIVQLDLQREAGEKFGARIFKDVVAQIVGQCKPGVHETKIDSAMSAAKAGPLFREEILELTRYVEESGRRLPIIVLLDEVERILPHASDTLAKADEFNAFSAVFRALKGVLTLLVSDVRPAADFINCWRPNDAAIDLDDGAPIELYVRPFSAEETCDMLNGIGGLMRREFDASVSQAIHRKSGGHPLLSRQIASLIVARRPNQRSFRLDEENRSLLEHIFDASPFFHRYCSEGILGDLRMIAPVSAEKILRCLACANRGVTLDRLIKKFEGEIPEMEMHSAVSTLQRYGLVVTRREKATEMLAILPELLSQLIRMTLSRKEREQWTL